jgi:hypothetical protein
MFKIDLAPVLVPKKEYYNSKRTDIPGKSKNGHGYQGIFDIGIYANFVPYKDKYLGACRFGNAGLKDDLEILDFDSNFNVIKRRPGPPGQDPRCFLHDGIPYALSWTPRLEIPPYDFCYNVTNLITGKVTELKVQFSDQSEKYRDLGKNWMALSKGSQLYFVVSIEPNISVLKCQLETGECTWVTDESLVNNGIKVSNAGSSASRGGTSWMYNKEHDCYYGLGHRTYNSHYHTAFLYVLSSDFKKVRIGPDITTYWSNQGEWKHIGAAKKPELQLAEEPKFASPQGISDPLSIFEKDEKVYCCIWHMPRTSSRSEKARGTLYEIVMKSMWLKEDNRNNLGVRIDPNHCEIGDLYKPWYFYENPVTGCPKDIEQICLIYRKQNKLLSPKNILGTSFLKAPMYSHRQEYLNQNLVKAIREQGQQVPIVCTKHFIKDSPPDIDFLEKDSDFDKIRCFEGHHRLVACDEMNIAIRAEVYSMYHMDSPIDWNKHYNSNFEDSLDFWVASEKDSRTPAYPIQFFNESSEIKKCLQECCDFIKKLGLKIESAIDIDCAEGALTSIIADEIKCNLLGVDQEPGRIIRAQLMRHKQKQQNVKYRVFNYDKVHYDDYDFVIFLNSLSLINTEESLNIISEMCKDSKVVLLRITKDHKTYENLFNELNMTVNKVVESQQQTFYVLWK